MNDLANRLASPVNYLHYDRLNMHFAIDKYKVNVREYENGKQFPNLESEDISKMLDQTNDPRTSSDVAGGTIPQEFRDGGDMLECGNIRCGWRGRTRELIFPKDTREESTGLCPKCEGDDLGELPTSKTKRWSPMRSAGRARRAS